MGRIVHFEIHAEDPERAAKFYSEIFGWTIAEMKLPSGDVPQDPANRYWLVTTGPEGTPGINGGILKRRGPAPAPDAAVFGYVCTVEVPSLDETSQKITGRGLEISLPKMPIQGVGWLAYFKDTEGNIFGVMQPDTNAK